MSGRKAIKVIIITLLTTTLLFTACGAATPIYTHATMTVRYVR
jgi:hypothetical protein